jgi:PST family polysaccharide transporter
VLLKKLQNKLNSPIVSNFFSLVILQGSNYLFPLLTVPYLYRILGVEYFGLVNFSTAFIQYFIILTDFGFNLSATKYIAANRDNKTKINIYFVNVLASKFILFLIGFIILLVLVFNFDKFSNDKTIYLLSYGSVLGVVLLPTWFFQGMEQMKYITRITIVTRFVSILPIFFFVNSDSDYLLVPFYYSIGSILAGLIGLYYAYQKFNLSSNLKGKISIERILQCLKESLDFFVSRISLSIYTISNTFILGIVVGNTAVGYYVAAEKLYTALQSMYGPLNQALYPYMVNSKDLNVFKKIFSVVVLINCIGIPICIFESDFIMHFIYSSIKGESIEVFKILLLTCLITVPSVLLGYPLLGAFGYTKYTNLTVIISSVFHLLILFGLYTFNYLTIYTVSFLVLLTELFVLILRIKGVKQKIFTIKSNEIRG